MHNLRLLERLKAWETGKVSRFSETSEEIILESIASHLERMLNTKQGGVKLFDDYGVPEFHDLSKGSIEVDIQNVITKYEPRLDVMNISRIELNDNMTSNIEISITGKIKGSDSILCFTTVLTSNGRVIVKL
jgi:type VI secretion system protein